MMITQQEASNYIGYTARFTKSKHIKDWYVITDVNDDLQYGLVPFDWMKSGITRYEDLKDKTPHIWAKANQLVAYARSTQPKPIGLRYVEELPEFLPPKENLGILDVTGEYTGVFSKTRRNIVPFSWEEFISAKKGDIFYTNTLVLSNYTKCNIVDRMAAHRYKIKCSVFSDKPKFFRQPWSFDPDCLHARIEAIIDLDGQPFVDSFWYEVNNGCFNNVKIQNPAYMCKTYMGK